MPKMKTKRTLNRRYKVTKNGKIKVFKSGHRHFLRKDSKRVRNEATKGQCLEGGAETIMKKYIPGMK